MGVVLSITFTRTPHSELLPTPLVHVLLAHMHLTTKIKSLAFQYFVQPAL